MSPERTHSPTPAPAANKSSSLLFVRPLELTTIKWCLEVGGPFGTASVFMSGRKRAERCGDIAKVVSRRRLSGGETAAHIAACNGRRYVRARCALGSTGCSARGRSERMWRWLRRRAPVMDGAGVTWRHVSGLPLHLLASLPWARHMTPGGRSPSDFPSCEDLASRPRAEMATPEQEAAAASTRQGC